MRNERLRKAMERAHVTAAELADRMDVDLKTVHRWTSGRQRPSAKHRYEIADVVGEQIYVLWPDGDEPITGTDVTDEVIAIWPHRADAPPDRWRSLLAKAEARIDLLGYAIQFMPEQDPRFGKKLIEKAEAGVTIRIALADPDCPHVEYRDSEEQLGGTLPARIRTTLKHLREVHGTERVKIQLHASPLYSSVFRFDDHMLMTPHLYGLPGYQAPLIHLRRLGADGVFDAYAQHFERVWQTTKALEPSE
jgi:transcriptional regulator with XRE-family HTH domain